MFSRTAFLVSATCAMAACELEYTYSPEGSDVMRVEGKITSAQTGAPISDVRVRLYRRSCWGGCITLGKAASTVSDATGWYEVAEYNDSNYQLTAFHPRFLGWNQPIGEGSRTQDIVLEARTP